MNKTSCPYLFILLFFYIGSSKAQSLVNVTPLTGAANVNIPIYTVTSGSLSVPVSFYYNTNGVKIKDVEGTAGMGWNLQAGGEVSREVRGLPDDYEQNNGGTVSLGWMVTSNPAPGKVAGFTPANVGDGICSKETADANYIYNNFSYYQDTEPDIFNVNAPGLSCQLVFDRNTNQFHPLVYQDIQISYSASSPLVSFTITNDKGVKYVFSSDEEVIQSAFDGSATYFSTLYNQYKNPVTYFDKWQLYTMTDATGNKIIFNYSNAPVRHGVDSVSLYLPGSTTPSLQYYIQTAVYSGILQSISTSNLNTTTPVQRLAFNWTTFSNPTQTGQTCISSIIGYNRQFLFTYTNVDYSVHSIDYYRNFLRNFTDVGTNTPVNYSFTYLGESNVGGSYTTTLPDSVSFKVDYWGYPNIGSTNTSLQPKVLVNPSNSAYSRYVIYQAPTQTGSYTFGTTNGQDRSGTNTNFGLGCLSNIINSQDGTSTITYEPNTYVDVPSGAQVTGGGVRVKTITDYDGMDATKNIVRNYSYAVPGSTKTSGKPITLPSYAFTIPYVGSATGQALWDAVTILSKTDLSNDDHSIIYGYFTMSQTGAGTIQYHLSTLGSNWDSNVVPICSGCSTIEWNPTINLNARTDCAVSSYGPVKNDIYSYPFIPSANFDFERGLSISIINTNDALQKVSETDYTYQQYTAGPMLLGTVTGFHTDDNPSATLLTKGYNLYTTYFNAGELISTVTKKVYDNQTLSNAQSNTITYTYGSANHEFPTAQSLMNSDNSVITTNTSYVKDYGISTSSTNAYINGLYNLQLENVNAPVETYQQVTRSGTTLTTGASLTLFQSYTLGSVTNYLPSLQYKLFSSSGKVFSPFSINTAAPSISKDAGYYIVANFDTYDNTGTVTTADDGYKHKYTSLRDLQSGMPTATFDNAAYNEIIFEDFDSQFAYPTRKFTISGSGFTATGSHTGIAYGLNSSQTVTSSTLTKNTITQNYIFSIWINAATGGTLTLNLTGITPSPTITYPAGGWTYYELKIPVGTLASTYTLSFTASTPISIDDILFYPDAAEVNTVAYDPSSYYKTAATSTNGISNYFTYDTWGRLTIKYDQFKNIIEKKTYVSSSQITQGLSAYIYSNTNPMVKNYPVAFSGGSNPVSGVYYQWQFGDGGTQNGYDLFNVSHTYTSSGSFTVTQTISSPFFPSSTITYPITVVANPPALFAHICSSGVNVWNNETNSYSTLFPVLPNCTGGGTTNSAFTIIQVDNSGYGPLNYQWQQKFNKSSTWTNVGGNSPTWISPSYSGIHQDGYHIQCIVSAVGQTSSTASSSVGALYP